MKKILLLIIIFSITLQVTAQNNYLFKDKETKLWGLENIDGEEVVPAKFENIIDYNDSLIIISEDDLYFVVDHEGNTQVKPNNYLLEFELFNPNHLGEIMVGTCLGYAYINQDGQCIPTDYYPCCTHFENIQKEGISQDLLYIQQSVDYLEEENNEKAIEFAQKAIDSNPNNPANYYWYSNLIINNLVYETSIKKTIKPYHENIENYINKAIELEKDTFNAILPLGRKHQFERKFNRNNKEKKIAYQQLKEYEAVVNRFGMMGGVGTSYSNNNYAVGLSLGYGGFERRLSNINNYWSFFQGLTYEHFFQNITDSYRYQSSFSYFWGYSSLELGMITDYKIRAFELRYDIGLSFYGLKLTAGYNFVSKKKFPEHRRFVFSLKYEFPILTNKYFTPYQLFN